MKKTSPFLTFLLGLPCLALAADPASLPSGCDANPQETVAVQSGTGGWQSIAAGDEGWIRALVAARKAFVPVQKPILVLAPPAAVVTEGGTLVTTHKKEVAMTTNSGTVATWKFTLKEEGEWVPFIIGRSASFGVKTEMKVQIDGAPAGEITRIGAGFTPIELKGGKTLASGEHTLEISTTRKIPGAALYAVVFSTDSHLDHELFDTGMPNLNRSLIQGLASRLWNDFPLQCDWFLQDNQVHGKWGDDSGEDSRGDYAAYLQQDRDNSLEKKLLEAVAAGSSAGLDFPAGDSGWLKAYMELCQKRRAARLKPLVEKAPNIVYAVHHNMGSIYLATQTQGCGPGSELRVLDLSPLAKGEPIADEQLFDAKGGIVRDPEISFDAKRLLFAWRKTNLNVNPTGNETTGKLAPSTGNYKIYEMELASRSLRPMTTDETYGSDIEPAYMPNGDILFSSDRCVQEVTCGFGDCTNLYLMNKDGKYARRLGFDQTQTAFPHLLDDGTVVYTRRDYNDRGQTYAHALFSMNPDGTKQTEYYKNQSCEPTSLQHTRQIPGTSLTMSIAGGYHTDQGGKLVTIDIKKGRQEFQGLTFFNWDVTAKVTSDDKFGREGEQYIYPFPLDASSFLIGFDPIGGYRTAPNGRLDARSEHYRLYYMTLDGQREMLASHHTLSCGQSAPVTSRPVPPSRSSSVNYNAKTGICYVQNVFNGSGSEGIAQGSIKKIRVVEIYYKPTTIGAGIWGPPGPEIGPHKKYSSVGYHSVLPAGVGTASFDCKGILGEVDVNEDGSAMFEVPARKPIFLQLIDKNGNVAQTMRSWMTLMPGENFSCVGCHEPKDAPPVANARRSVALKNPPQQLKAFAGVTGKPFSYAKMVQPIWNQHCVSCHAPGKETAKIDLSDTLVEDHNLQEKPAGTLRKYHQSYLTLLKVGRRPLDGTLDPGTPNEWVQYWTRLLNVEPKPPYYAGSAKSKLITLLKERHQKTSLTEDEIGIVSAWIDLNVPYVGEYDEMNNWSPDQIDLFQKKLGVRVKNEEIEQKNIAEFIKDGQP